MTYHVIICTGAPASGKTTLLKELAMTGAVTSCYHSRQYDYHDIDRHSEPLIFKLSNYESKTQLLDGLFMDTSRVAALLDAMSTKYKEGSKLTVYRFEDNKEQCKWNDLSRPPKRQAWATIDKPYNVNFELLAAEYPGIELEIIDTPVYKPTPWELWFARGGFLLNYKVLEDSYSKAYEIVQGRVNKRYLISTDHWDTSRRSKTIDGDWYSSDDNEPLKFVELENLLLTIPTLSYKQGLELAALAEIVSYPVRDYYESAERHYHCVDAELLYNHLIATPI